MFMAAVKHHHRAVAFDYSRPMAEEEIHAVVGSKAMLGDRTLGHRIHGVYPCESGTSDCILGSQAVASETHCVRIVR
jgi:hypothetical protein